MYGLIIKVLYLVFLAYIAIAIFICLRDLLLTKGSKLWIPLIAILFGVAILAFRTSALPALALPLTLLVSVPIFLTDKRRKWDAVDQVFRWVSLMALLAAAYVTVNYFYLR